MKKIVITLPLLAFVGCFLGFYSWQSEEPQAPWTELPVETPGSGPERVLQPLASQPRPVFEAAHESADVGDPALEVAPEAPTSVVPLVTVDPAIAQRFGLGQQEIRESLLAQTAIWQGKSLGTIGDIIRSVPDLSMDQLDRIIAFLELNERGFCSIVSKRIVLSASEKGQHSVVSVSTGMIRESSPREYPQVKLDFAELRSLYDDFFFTVFDAGQHEAFRSLTDRWGWRRFDS